MSEYRVSLNQDEKTTIQNALINMRYSSAMDDELAEALSELISRFQAMHPVPEYGYER
ncbi:MAG: hypothetical protein IKZ82_01590 [Clostridia bacterium]|nr:hypothetical protein [Clostridia bacterium]